MAQAPQTIPLDSKMNTPAPQSSQYHYTQSAPPAYPAYSSYPQHTSVPQQPPLGALSSQQIPMGAISPQQFQMGTIPPQQVYLGPMSPQQAPPGTFSPPFGTYPAQQVPLPHLPTQAQIGQQYQAAQFAQCAYGNHARSTKFGLLGVIGAIVFFPIGLLCLFADKQDICLRCGQRL